MIELFRTSTFRLVLFYFCLFATSVLAVLALIYYDTVVYAGQQTDETIDAEITGLAEQYRQRGLSGLIAVIEERADPARGSVMLYLLTDAAQHPLAGNLSRWPDVTIKPDGWMEFSLEQAIPGQRRHIAQATSFQLRGGYQLLVGRDLAERLAFQGRITRALIWSAVLTLALGLFGGVIMSRRLLARIATMNRASDEVMAGDLGRRIPVGGTGDELDHLALNLNLMLDRIEHLMQGMRQVTDNIAHDLRSPLGRMRNRIEMALLEEAPEASLGSRAREVMQQTIAESDQLLATFNALLDIAEAEAGGPRATMAPLDLGPLIRDLADFYEPVAEDAGLSLALRGGDQAFWLRGNRHLISRALANLVENAIKYTPDGGEVTISAEGADDTIRLTVADTGPGIPPEARDSVFDRFVRLETSRTTPGNGLGLSLARAVIRLHGGTITLEDNGPGLRAVVRLPRQVASTASSAADRTG